MAWSNIVMQLTTLTGPILGESQYALPFTAQIELTEFSWSMGAHRNPEMKGGFKPSLSGAVGSFLGVGGKDVQVQLGHLEFRKRFDIASLLKAGANEIEIDGENVAGVYRIMNPDKLASLGRPLLLPDSVFVK